MPSPTVTPTSLLQSLPKNTVGTLPARLAFAAIAILNVAYFTLNKTTDTIAWITDDSREKSWAPFVLANLILAFLTQLLIRKLTPTPEQIKAAMECLTKIFPAQTQPTPNPALNAFPSDGELAKNFKRAGLKLFSQPTSSSSPTPVCAGQEPNSTLFGPRTLPSFITSPTSPSFITPPSERAPTRPPTPVSDPTDALLNATYDETCAMAQKKISQ